MIPLNGQIREYAYIHGFSLTLFSLPIESQLLKLQPHLLSLFYNVFFGAFLFFTFWFTVFRKTVTACSYMQDFCIIHNAARRFLNAVEIVI